ncbi:MAG: YhdH/YhfP family quinone oxidoreductase [Desulfosarcinaceae bacterium]|nr:YhdH/YhfP family quinone oxidoreductase [Desulfosarcinaceae bacterium]
MNASDTFKALIVSESTTDTPKFERRIGTRQVADLPPGDVLIQVHYSSLNYKDALSASGNKGVTRQYPHTPGIDAAGEVILSEDDRFRSGQQVLVTGYDLGMNTAGGFGERIRVPADWVVPIPEGLSSRTAMIYGTAGFTAGLGVHLLLDSGLRPDEGEILVTGATGGVGSLAVAILAKIGFSVVAASGKSDQQTFLERLGAARCVERDTVVDTSSRPLLKQQWAGVFECVGGPALETAIRATKTHGTVVCCGNVAAAELRLTVYPFILRGVRLIGIDSATAGMSLRRQVWDRLAGEWRPDGLEDLAAEIGLAELENNIGLILQGKQVGRKVVRL